MQKPMKKRGLVKFLKDKASDMGKEITDVLFESSPGSKQKSRQIESLNV